MEDIRWWYRKKVKAQDLMMNNEDPISSGNCIRMNFARNIVSREKNILDDV